MVPRNTTSSALPDALTKFDLLPDSAFVRQPVVEGLFSCSGTTVWRMVRRGKLITKKLAPRVTGFNVGSLRKALSV